MKKAMGLSDKETCRELKELQQGLPDSGSISRKLEIQCEDLRIEIQGEPIGKKSTKNILIYSLGNQGITEGFAGK